MKKVKYILVSGLLSVFLFSACEPFELAPEDLTLSFDVSIFDGYINVIYFDAATGVPLGLEGDPDIQVQLNCSHENVIVNPDAEYQTSYDLQRGFFSFAINPYGTQPSVDNPFIITLETITPGFVDHYQTIVLSEARTYNYEINLINTEAPPEGVTIEENLDVGDSSAEGEIEEDIVLETEDEDVQVTIESGSVLTDENGDPLQGKVSVHITRVDVEDEEGLKNLPGLNQPILTEDGTESTLSKPLAYTKIDIRDESGRKAYTIKGSDLIVMSAIPTGFIHPGTGQEIKAGDEVPSYGFSTNSGSWIYMGPDPVVYEDGKLFLVKTITSSKASLMNELETGNISDITYTFDSEDPIDLLINLTVPNEILPTRITLTITDEDGLSVFLPSNEILIKGDPDESVTTVTTTLRFNNLAASDFFQVKVSFNQYTGIYITGTATTSNNLAEVDMEASGSLFGTGEEITTNFIIDFKFTCEGTSGQKVDQQGAGVSFTLTFREIGTSSVKILQVENGTFEIDFDPTSPDAPYFESRIYRGDFSYPGYGEWEPIIRNNFTPVGESGNHFLYHHIPSDSQTTNYTKEERCDDFIKIFGL